MNLISSIVRSCLSSTSSTVKNLFHALSNSRKFLSLEYILQFWPTFLFTSMTPFHLSLIKNNFHCLWYHSLQKSYFLLAQSILHLTLGYTNPRSDANMTTVHYTWHRWSLAFLHHFPLAIAFSRLAIYPNHLALQNSKYN